jgi:oxalate decarboxylase
MNFTENPISRRIMLAAAAAGSALTAATAADAQSGDVREPRRPGRGGDNPGPKNPGLIDQNPIGIRPRSGPTC